MKLNNIGSEIRRERKKAGLTQAELAKLLDVSQPVIGQYERGARFPRPQTILRIADALRVHFSVLAPVSGLTDLREIEKTKQDFNNYVLGETQRSRIELGIGDKGSALIRVPGYITFDYLVASLYQMNAFPLLAKSFLTTGTGEALSKEFEALAKEFEDLAGNM